VRCSSRDWRAGELTVLVAALMLAVASIGTVGFFADRVKGALAQQANLLLGADVLISGDRPLPDTFARRRKARACRDAGAEVQQHGAARRRDAEGAGAVLGDVKAVAPVIRCEARSCCRRQRRAREARRGIPQRGERGPMRGSPRASARSAGDSIAVGDATLKVTAIVQQEPEVASGILAIAPVC
jgi:putative ABC transport system permease protein